MASIVKKIAHRIESWKYGWSGNYKTWNDAKKASTGYESDLIVEKVKNALIKVRNGEAAFERDSVLFYEIEYSWELLTALLWVASRNEGKLRVIDFGGSLGTTYFQHRKFLDAIKELRWNVVEQRVFVKAGKETFQDDRLRFYEDVASCLKDGVVDVVLFCCVLHYLESPYEMLADVMKQKPPFIIVDNMPFIDGPDRITVQKVPPDIYPASYPCWLLNRQKFLDFVGQFYDRELDYKSDLTIRVDGRPIKFEGYFFKLKKNS